jgi:uncharacterized protein YqeY
VVWTLGIRILLERRKDMGKVMVVLKERYAGQMDFSKASAATKDGLSGK